MGNVSKALQSASNIYELIKTECKTIKEKMGRSEAPNDVMHRVKIVAKVYLDQSGELASNIIKSVNQSDYSMDILKVQPLLELAVNARYIFRHPDHYGDATHMRWASEDMNRRESADSVEGKAGYKKFIVERASELKLLEWTDSYSLALRAWDELMKKATSLSDRITIMEYISNQLRNTILYSFDVLESVAVGFEIDISDPLKQEVIGYTGK
jgi:hypothetical protein